MRLEDKKSTPLSICKPSRKKAGLYLSFSSPSSQYPIIFVHIFWNFHKQIRLKKTLVQSQCRSQPTNYQQKMKEKGRSKLTQTNQTKASCHKDITSPEFSNRSKYALSIINSKKKLDTTDCYTKKYVHHMPTMAGKNWSTILCRLGENKLASYKEKRISKQQIEACII